MNPVDMIFRILASVILGGIIGVERESKHRPAGFRTHILVCMGAATVMIISEMLFMQYNERYGLMSDPARMGAQVISGIGFLGAGTIMRYGANIRGLTTAASIWAVGCVGLACGAGFYVLAIIVTGLLFCALFVFAKISAIIEDNMKVRRILISMKKDENVIGKITLILAQSSLKILKTERVKEEDVILETDKINFKYTIQFETASGFDPIMLELAQIEGVLSVEQI